MVSINLGKRHLSYRLSTTYSFFFSFHVIDVHEKRNASFKTRKYMSLTFLACRTKMYWHCSHTINMNNSDWSGFITFTGRNRNQLIFRHYKGTAFNSISTKLFVNTMQYKCRNHFSTGKVKPVYNGHSQKDKKNGFKNQLRLMQVKSIL